MPPSNSPPNRKRLAALQRKVTACERCPRLIEHCREVAAKKRRAYLDWDYWGRPVPSFGDPAARLLIVGLAPGAHGANRTGRMFTGDSSGDFLYRALYENGFASQPESVSIDDGLTLNDVYITAPVRCAPPQNRPSPEEFYNCRWFLEKELVYLTHLTVVVVLGRLALDSYLRVLKQRGAIDRISAYPFAHNRLISFTEGLPPVLCSYHPSRQNTQTGRLTKAMLRGIFRRARALL